MVLEGKLEKERIKKEKEEQGRMVLDQLIGLERMVRKMVETVVENKVDHKVVKKNKKTKTFCRRLLTLLR